MAVEELIGQGKIGEAGLCDLHPPVFKYIYNNAQIKPISIQVTSPLTSLTLTLLPSPPSDQPQELLCGARGAQRLREGESHHPLHPLRPQ